MPQPWPQVSPVHTKLVALGWYAAVVNVGAPALAGLAVGVLEPQVHLVAPAGREALERELRGEVVLGPRDGAGAAPAPGDRW